MWLKFDCGCFETMQFAYKFSPLEGKGAQLLLWGTPDLGVCCGGGDKGLLCWQLVLLSGNKGLCYCLRLQSDFLIIGSSTCVIHLTSPSRVSDSRVLDKAQPRRTRNHSSRNRTDSQEDQVHLGGTTHSRSINSGAPPEREFTQYIPESGFV